MKARRVESLGPPVSTAKTGAASDECCAAGPTARAEDDVLAPCGDFTLPVYVAVVNFVNRSSADRVSEPPILFSLRC